MDWIVIREKSTQWLGKYRYVLLVLLVGVVLMFLPARKETTNETVPTVDAPSQKQNIREELVSILGQIEGVGDVRVMLTVAAGEKTLYQTDADISENTSRIETVIVTDANRKEVGLVQQINPPTYLGAIVVCKGAGNAAVRLAVVEAVSRITGLGADRISVLKMK